MKPEEIQDSAVLYTSDRDIMLDKADGPYIWDTDGKRYLDFAGAIAVNALGNVNPEITQALKEQMDKLGQTSMSHNTIALEKTSRLLVDQFDPKGKAFWANSGAEANETAMKAICFYQHTKGRNERDTIITFDGAFHGRTWRTLSATGKYMEGMGVDSGGFKRLPYNDIEAVKAAMDDNIAGILVEPLQGEGGILVPSQEFLQTLRELANEHDLVLAFDEVQCGMGRLGKLFGHEAFDVKPDIVTLAKALSGGAIPVSATLMNQKISDALTNEGKVKFSNGTTYGGNPLALTAAGKTLEIMLRENNEFLGKESSQNAILLKDSLQGLVEQFPTLAKEVRGLGFMLGLKLQDNHNSFAMVGKLRENGLFTMFAGDNVLRFVPPLNIKPKHIAEAVEVLKKTFQTELDREAKQEKTVSRADLARRLWNEYLKVEYYDLAELARDEWNPKKASHSVPKYYANGDRVVGRPKDEFFEDETYKEHGGRDEHYAVRTYILDTDTMGSQLEGGELPNRAVFGRIQSDGNLPQGIPLVGRIMGVLGYRRGANNLGETYFQLNSPTGEEAKNMFADAIHFEPPKDAPELPKQFVSQIHIQDLRGTHPKLANYIEAMMRAAPDPMQGLEGVMRKLAKNEKVTPKEADAFLEAAAKSIKERPWKIPLELAAEEGWSTEKWDREVTKLQEVLAEHEKSPTEASQYAVWTIFNGLRVNHQAFLTGNIWDTMLCHIIDGREVIDPAGTEKSHITDHVGGMELGGLLQAAVAAIPREFTFAGPEGKSFSFSGEGPFVEYIERTMVKTGDSWQRVNDAFLPGNAKQVFQSTMPQTRDTQSWAEEMKTKLEKNPEGLLRECERKGWAKATQKLNQLDIGISGQGR